MTVKGHTWYLNQEYIPLCLVSENVSDKEKEEIAKKILSFDPPEKYFGGHPTEVELPKCRKLGLKRTLSDSIYNGSHFLFDVLKFEKDWLKEPVSTWKNISSYQVFERFVKTLNVCNDSAERAIKLISDYSNSLTKDNEEREKIRN